MKFPSHKGKNRHQSNKKVNGERNWVGDGVRWRTGIEIRYGKGEARAGSENEN